LTSLIEAARDNLVATNKLPDAVAHVRVEITDTKNPDHGDYACNFAMTATKAAGMPPRQIGELLQRELQTNPVFQAIDLAGPGFLNFRLAPEAISKHVPTVLEKGSTIAQIDLGKGERINVEFVSVNPNGPITIGSGRGAAFGDTICRVLNAAGYEAYREYYINDGINSEQMRLFSLSVRHYYREMIGLATEFPEKGYKGEYVQDVAKTILAQEGPDHAEEPTSWFQKISQVLMIERQRSDLKSFRVCFDIWYSEQSMHDAGKVMRALEMLEKNGNAYRSAKAADAEEDPEAEQTSTSDKEALWLRSTAFGDDKDRVLVRADGRPTYISPDIAYLQDKFDRGFSRQKMILGPDHHGYMGRLYAVARALGHTVGHDGEFEIVIYQIVRFVKEGKPAPMRKRDGNIYELRDLISELGETAAPEGSKEEQLRIGADVARFFFLMRSHETHMDFDIDLATKQSDENPVFYAQYAHARLSGVIAKAKESGLTPNPEHWKLLTHPKELALIKKILDLPYDVERTVADYGVHRLTVFATELARTYHHFYDACRVIQPEEPELSQARLALCEAARIALAATFDLLGVSAPERM
jgi:arginyl-tRNA synthetase